LTNVPLSCSGWWARHTDKHVAHSGALPRIALDDDGSGAIGASAGAAGPAGKPNAALSNKATNMGTPWNFLTEIMARNRMTFAVLLSSPHSCGLVQLPRAAAETAMAPSRAVQEFSSKKSCIAGVVFVSSAKF
jgi:hypothetical protein